MFSHSFWQTLALSLRHPTTIAAFASVGLHATIGVALPTLPLFSTGGGGGTIRPRNVQLIELTPAEAARLPQLYTTPETEYSFDLPNAPESEFGLPSFTTGAIPRARENDRPRQRLRASRPNLPPRPDGTRAAPSGTNRSLLNLAARDRTVTQRNRSPRNIPAPPSRNIPTFSEPTAPNNGLSREEQLRRGLFVESNENAQLPSSDLNSLAEAGRESARVENLTPNLPQPPSLDPPLSPQELAARQRDNAAADRIARQRGDYRYNPKNTTPEAERENERRWLESVNQPQARVQSRSITLQGAYPQAACINRAQGTAIYRVVVQPNGRKTDVQQIRSTGYRILDRAAIAQVSGAGLGRESVPVPYRITIPFNYNANICPTLAIPRRSPSPPPSPTRPSPSPTVSPSPEVAPSPSPSPTPTSEPTSEPSAMPTESPTLTPTESPKKPKEIVPNNEQ